MKKTKCDQCGNDVFLSYATGDVNISNRGGFSFRVILKDIAKVASCVNCGKEYIIDGWDILTCGKKGCPGCNECQKWLPPHIIESICFTCGNDDELKCLECDVFEARQHYSMMEVGNVSLRDLLPERTNSNIQN